MMTCALNTHYILNIFLLKAHFLSVTCTNFKSIRQGLPWMTKEDHLLELWSLESCHPFSH